MSKIEIADPRETDWLQHLQPPYGSGDETYDRKQGYHLTDVALPAGYESYIRIFHPFVPWDADSKELVPAERRATWHDLARRAGVEFHAELMWDSLEPALPLQGDRREFALFTGQLELGTRLALTRDLVAASHGESVFYWYSLTAVINGRDPILLSAAVSEVENVMAYARKHDLAVTDQPEYIWPADRSWIVVTDWDLDSTYVAGAAELGTTLVANPDLEALAVEPFTRVDRYADTVNLHPRG